MVTSKSVTEAQISGLQTSAGTAGDVMMAAICEVALKGSIDIDDWALSSKEARKVADMTRDEALTAVVDAINDAEGR